MRCKANSSVSRSIAASISFSPPINAADRRSTARQNSVACSGPHVGLQAIASPTLASVCQCSACGSPPRFASRPNRRSRRHAPALRSWSVQVCSWACASPPTLCVQIQNRPCTPGRVQPRQSTPPSQFSVAGEAKVSRVQAGAHSAVGALRVFGYNVCNAIRPPLPSPLVMPRQVTL